MEFEHAFVLHNTPPMQRGRKHASEHHELHSAVPSTNLERNANDEVLHIRQTARNIANTLYELHYGTPTADQVVLLATIQNELTRYFVHARSSASTDLKRAIEEHLCHKGEVGTADSPGSKDRGAWCRTLAHAFFEGTGPYIHDHAVRGAREEAHYIRERMAVLGMLPERKGVEASDFCYDLSTNPYIDAHYAVDLTEIAYKLGTNKTPGHIASLRLVQVKARIPPEEVPALVESIHTKHARYAASLAHFPLERFDPIEQRATECRAYKETEALATELVELLVCANDIPGDITELATHVQHFFDQTSTVPVETRTSVYECLQQQVTTMSEKLETGPLKQFLEETRHRCETMRDACLREQQQTRRKREEILVPVARILSVIVCNGKEHVHEIPVAAHPTEAVGLGYRAPAT